MNVEHLSPIVNLRMSDNRVVEFRRYPKKDFPKPLPKDCQGPITGVCLNYAFCGEQDFGISPILQAFGAYDKNMVMARTPVEIIETKNMKAMVFGEDIYLTDKVNKATKEAGVIGYWDKSNFAICACDEYGFIIDELRKLVKPKNARFSYSETFGGRCNLLIVKN